MLVETLSTSKDIVMGKVGDVFVLVCRGEVTGKSTAGMTAFMDQAAQKTKNGFGLLTVVEAGSKPPDREVRGTMAKILMDHRDNLKCAAVVVEGRGFLPSLVRSVTTGIAVIARTPFPYEVMSHDAANAFFAEHLGGPNVEFDEGSFREKLGHLRNSDVVGVMGETAP